MENENIEDESTRVWEDILSNLFVLPFGDTAAIVEQEQQIYKLLAAQPGRIEGMITLMFEQIMVGSNSKARSLAYQIWDTGGVLSPFFELVYIENLLSLGLIDMATILLKPKFESLRENLEDFYCVMLKFAVMTGNIPLLERLGEYEQDRDDELLFDFAAVYAAENLTEPFKNLQRLIWEQTSKYLCAYEYSLYDDKGYPELEVEIYVNFDRQYIEKMQTNLEAKIDAYWASSGHQRLDNFVVRVDNIKNHPAWLEED